MKEKPLFSNGNFKSFKSKVKKFLSKVYQWIYEHPKILNSASEILLKMFGDKSKHRRCFFI